MDPWVAAGVALVIVTAGFVGGLSASAAPADAQRSVQPQTTPEGFTNAEFEIRVHADGSVRWTVRASRPLENESEREQFEAFAEEFEKNETSAFRNFRARARRLAAFGTNATGREMNATDFQRDARVVELGRTRGVVELSFRWTNFARTDGERVVVDDVFEGGMFVDSGQRLVIARGEGLVFASVDPPPDSQSAEENLTASETVTWFGERSFADQRPYVAFVPAERATDGDAPATDSPGSSNPTPTAAASPDGGSSGGPGAAALLVALVVLLGLGGGFALYSSTTRGSGGGLGTATGSTDGASAATEAGADATAPASDAAGSPVTEAELLSDEDRVLRLLEENGGRMKQVDIVEETEWSKSKVSMLLSDMAEEGEISKLRVGRENIISKAGHEPEAAGSPFEEDV